MSAVTYSNWYAKLLLAKSFENQHFMPLPPKLFERAGLSLIERAFFPKDVDALVIDRPVFIIGLPRSGTTLLYNLLCAHEQAAYITNVMNAYPEWPRAIEWVRKALALNARGERFFKDSIDTDLGSPSEPHSYWQKWVGRDVDQLYWPELRATDLAPAKVRAAHRDVKKVLACFGGGGDGGAGRRFICKHPLAQTELRLIQDLFPGVRFVHIVRDGKDVANSLLKLNRISNEQLEKTKHPHGRPIVVYPRVPGLRRLIADFGPDDIRTTAAIWQESIDVVNAAKGDLAHFHELRYEDLLKDPAGVMRALFAFCELPAPGPDNAAYAREFAGIGKLRHVNAYKDFDQVTKFAGRVLAQYGY